MAITKRSLDKKLCKTTLVVMMREAVVSEAYWKTRTFVPVTPDAGEFKN